MIKSRDNCLPTLNGADTELGNFIRGLERPGGTGYEASRALLREIEGFPKRENSYHLSAGGYQPAKAASKIISSARSAVTKACLPPLKAPTAHSYVPIFDSPKYSYPSYGYGYDPQDWGRKFIGNGGCVYIDMDHAELCIPEVRSALEHVAYFHAMLRVAREAQQKANEKLPAGQSIEVLVNNSDGHGNSQGAHVNFLISRKTFNNIFYRKPHYMQFLASYLASSIIFTGAGKVGSENDCPPVNYQLSQRADFMETLVALQTTYHRPILNSRDESLCGSRWGNGSHSPEDEMARLHVIFFDSNLCQVACFLKVGVTQIVLAMLEQEWISPNLLLDDPLEALLSWSHDPTLTVKNRLVIDSRYTAAELQLAIFNLACRFVATGGAEGIVPQVHEIMDLWGNTLECLSRGEVEALAPRLDWVLKLHILRSAMSKNKLSWDSPKIKYLDHIYSSLNPDEGLYLAFEKSGAVQRLVPESEIVRAMYQPPEDTRAWLRSEILRRAEPADIEDVDWDSIRLRIKNNGRSLWLPYSSHTLEMNNPLGSSRKELEAVFAESSSFSESLQKLGIKKTADFGTMASPVSYHNPPGQCTFAGNQLSAPNVKDSKLKADC